MNSNFLLLDDKYGGNDLFYHGHLEENFLPAVRGFTNYYNYLIMK